MISRIDISTGLKRCISKDCENCPYVNYSVSGSIRDCTAALAEETLLLLESDMREIELLNKVVQKNRVVRCKDCKHYHPGFTCDLMQKPIMSNADWYCADSEVKTNV